MKNDVWMPAILLAHMGTPFLAGLVVLTMTVIAKDGRLKWAEANDAALDLVILSIGATGPLLLEHKFRENFRPDMAVYGILLVLVNLLLAGILVARKKRIGDKELTFANVWPDFFLGIASLALTTGAFYFAYNSVGGQHA